MGCAHACGIRNAAVPTIRPNTTQVDLIGKFFIFVNW